MKKIMAIFGLLLIFSACSSNDDTADKSTDTNKDLVEQAKEILGTDDNSKSDSENVMSGYTDVPADNVFVGVNDSDVQSMLDNNETFYLYFGRPT